MPKSSGVSETPDLWEVVELLEKLDAFDLRTEGQESGAKEGEFRDAISSGEIVLRSDRVRRAVISSDAQLEDWLLASAKNGEEMGIPRNLVPDHRKIVFFLHVIFGAQSVHEIEKIRNEIADGALKRPGDLTEN